MDTRLNAVQRAALRRFQQLGLLTSWELTETRDVVRVVTSADDRAELPLDQLSSYLRGLSHGSWAERSPRQRSGARSETGALRTDSVLLLALLVALAIVLLPGLLRAWAELSSVVRAGVAFALLSLLVGVVVARVSTRIIERQR
jgi:hypothetical protein